MSTIAIGVHGRFYAFDLAAALLQNGVDVRLFTNYPRSVVERFGFPRERTSTLVRQGVAARIADRILGGREPRLIEASLKRYFGRWLSRNLRQGYDTVFCWSGVAEEVFRATHAARLLNRSSFHIAAQRSLLETEAARVGCRLQAPTPWIVAREEREYALADLIIIHSEAARRSFAQHAPHVRTAVVPLTAASEQWRAAADVVEARIARLRAGEKLRVAFVGNVSFQKGMYDLAEAITVLHQRVDFRLTGYVQPECRDLVAKLAGKTRVDGHVPEASLRAVYAWADIVIVPSIHDGYSVVLAHAQAAAVPILASEHTGGPELLAMGGRGWLVPIRAARAIVRQLEWCDDNRESVCGMVQELAAQPPKRSWRDVASELMAHAQAARNG